ncbi:DUF1624 domain-containing protein [Subdoligranulum sp. DSM 109015]|uniref:DUF1624 domain-containing protein n=1 Tax=Gemmiger gallinarum TaxID=2779354 RepID=A0ABR9R320_9FIRM|nr:heparan-alpha-glucosaminide N-acetyltransferase domain-containing protein [Gemmiger gallinarum]MBE5037531.1 DUF1624 domain-containing protein [Gemmiger gallinarum]
MEQGAKRIWQMDALRGLALLNMLVYHGMYDWVYVFGHPSRWYDIGSAGCHVWQQYICWSFILLSGASFCLGRRQLKNGLLTAGCALILTAVTALVMPSELILFGVLHFNACAVLLTCLLRPVLEKIPAGAGLAASAVLFAVLNQLPWGYLGFEELHLAAAVPQTLYRANLFWLGLPDLTRFASADYFPILPWLFLFWCGYFGWRWLTGLGRVPAAAKPPAALRPLCAVGSRTLLVYMLHQPAIYGVLLAVDGLTM